MRGRGGECLACGEREEGKEESAQDMKKGKRKEVAGKWRKMKKIDKRKRNWNVKNTRKMGKL